MVIHERGDALFGGKYDDFVGFSSSAVCSTGDSQAWLILTIVLVVYPAV